MAKTVLYSHPLSKYEMSKLMPPTAPVLFFLEDWGAPGAEGELAPSWEGVDPPGIGSLMVEDDQAD